MSYLYMDWQGACHGLDRRRGGAWLMSTQWTPNKVTLLRVVVGFAAVCLFGRGPWANLAAVGLTVTTIALDALDGHIARRKNLATPVGAQLDILGDRMIENVYFTYFAVVGMVSLWLPVFFFARGAATDFLRGLAMKRGPVALLGELAADVHAMIGVGAQIITWATAAFCLVRGLPVLVEGWKYIVGSVGQARGAKDAMREAA